MTLVLCVILLALVFEYVNGFHDTANAIATVVSTRVLSPRQAVALAAACNLFGSLWGTAVATTIGSGLVDTAVVTTHTLLAALLAAVFWNLLTWRLGLPSSSSHALIGGLCGASVASASGNLSVIHWTTATRSGVFAELPGWLDFLHCQEFHDPRDLVVDYGRRRHAAPQRRKMECRGTNGVDLGLHLARHGALGESAGVVPCPAVRQSAEADGRGEWAEGGEKAGRRLRSPLSRPRERGRG